MNNEKVFFEKEYRLIVQHGLQSIVERLLENERSIKITRGEAGSNLIIVEKADDHLSHLR